jgi:hypothetical protein
MRRELELRNFGFYGKIMPGRLIAELQKQLAALPKMN